MNNNIEEAKKCLTALGNAYRGDWSDVDGRAIRNELDEVKKVLDGEITYLMFCRNEGIDPVNLNWVDSF